MQGNLHELQSPGGHIMGTIRTRGSQRQQVKSNQALASDRQSARLYVGRTPQKIKEIYNESSASVSAEHVLLI